MFGSILRQNTNKFYVPNNNNFLHVISKLPQPDPIQKEEAEKKTYYYQKQPKTPARGGSERRTLTK